jgi:hypothetical protein
MEIGLLSFGKHWRGIRMDALIRWARESGRTGEWQAEKALDRQQLQSYVGGTIIVHTSVVLNTCFAG